MLRSSCESVPSVASRGSNGVAIALAFAVTSLVVLTLVIGSTADEEEFRFAILSAWLHVDALRHGSLGLWTPLLGLGVPQPFVPNFLLHPLLPLLALMSPVTWARVLLATHTAVGGLGMWQLTRYLKLSPIVRATCVATLLLATPAQNYALTDFWPSHYLVWTSMPWLVLFAWRLLESNGRQVRFWSVALGLSLGLVAVNTNPGHVVVYALLVAALLLAQWRPAIARWPWLLLAGGIAAAIALPTIVQLTRERLLFAPDSRLGLGDQGMPLPPLAAWNAFVSPFGADPSDWKFTRTIYFGGPFAVLAILGAVQFARRRPDLAIVMVAGLFLLFTSLVPLPFVSARFQMRDPVTLAAILLAGLSLDAIARRGRTWLICAIVFTQILLLVAAAWPALRRSWSEDGRQARWFRGAAGDAEAIDALARLAQPGGRMLFTPALDEIVFDNRRIEEGLGVNALAYHHLPLVNGWFKGVSADVISPDERLFYGRIATPRPLIQSPASMSALGIRWILGTSEGEDTVPGLKTAGTVTLSNDMRLTLYENASAIDGGFLVAPDAANLGPAALAGCESRRLLCTDLAPLLDRRLPDAVAVRARDNGFDVRVMAAAVPRILVFSEMHRRDWVAASSAGPLATRPIQNALLGVEVPPGVGTLAIRYRPVPLIAALVIAWATIATTVVVLAMIRRDRAVPYKRRA